MGIASHRRRFCKGSNELFYGNTRAKFPSGFAQTQHAAAEPPGLVSAIESIPPYRGVGRGAGVKRGRLVRVSLGEWLLGMSSTVLTWIGTGRRPRSQSFPESRRIIPAPTNDT